MFILFSTTGESYAHLHFILQIISSAQLRISR